MQDQPPQPEQAPRHNLPTRLTRLIGREQEEAEVCALLRRSDVYLVTLTGPPGIGKTRLALQVAADLIEVFDDGVCFVALATVRDQSLVVSTIAEALGIREFKGQISLESLKIHLRHKKLLLLLDNFEQVAVAAPLLLDLMDACPGINALVTSRTALRVRIEREFVVPPLALPDPRLLPSLGGKLVPALSRYGAVELFIQQACAVKPDFAMTEANAPTIAAICSRLDGLPLAIELAAARSKHLSPQKLLERLDRCLTLLTQGAQDMPTRHQTLRAAIDWSYDLLNVDEQMLFRRLGVFVGGCGLEAVETVCNMASDLPPSLFDMLSSLIDKSLLWQEEVGDGETRFMMIETIREYALERLVAAGEADALHYQHLIFFLEHAEWPSTELSHVAQKLWLDWLEVEHDNLRAALNWALEHSEVEMARRLSIALWQFWWEHGHISEGWHWLEESLAGEGDASAVVRAKTLVVAGWLAWMRRETTRAEKLCKESYKLFEELGDKRGLAFALGVLGLVTQSRGGYKLARGIFEDVLVTYREVGDWWCIAEAAFLSAMAACIQADYQIARPLLEESLRLFCRLRNRGGIANAISGLGLVALCEGNLVEAHDKYMRSLRLFEKLGSNREVAVCLMGLAGVMAAEGQTERAARLLGTAEAIHDSLAASLPHAYRDYYRQHLAPLRTRTAWAEGWSMTPKQALAACEAPQVSLPLPKAFGLTRREFEVLRGLFAGQTYGEIGKMLTITHRTVNAHVTAIYQKFGVHSRREAIRYAIANNLLSPT